MKNLLLILKRTLIRGILFLVPILLSLVLLDRIIDKLQDLANPIADRLPYHSFLGVGKAYWAVFLILLAIGMVMGIIARIKIATKFSSWLEDNFLSLLPGYYFVKQMVETMVGIDEEKTYQVVLLSVEDMWQLAYVMERINEDVVAIYVPSTPDPREGELYFVTNKQYKEVNITYKESLAIIRRQGKGSGKFLKDTLV